jgi:hypothetical protein
MQQSTISLPLIAVGHTLNLGRLALRSRTQLVPVRFQVTCGSATAANTVTAGSLQKSQQLLCLFG